MIYALILLCIYYIVVLTDYQAGWLWEIKLVCLVIDTYNTIEFKNRWLCHRHVTCTAHYIKAGRYHKLWRVWKRERMSMLINCTWLEYSKIYLVQRILAKRFLLPKLFEFLFNILFDWKIPVFDNLTARIYSGSTCSLLSIMALLTLINSQ